jgi:hypothetical protein
VGVRNTWLACARAPAARTAAAVKYPKLHYPTFYDALGKTPNTNYGRQIVEGLKLQTTLSNPKLALTVFMPEDQVGRASPGRRRARAALRAGMVGFGERKQG